MTPEEMTPEPCDEIRHLDDATRWTQATGVRSGLPVRQLLVVYAGLWALLDLVALLPQSNPSFSSNWGVVASVFIQCLLVWRLSLGSAVAWGFGLFMALGSVVSLALMDATRIGVSESLFVVLCLAQAGVLLTPAVRHLVRSQHKTPPAAA
jgi:hypothetical protein